MFCSQIARDKKLKNILSKQYTAISKPKKYLYSKLLSSVFNITLYERFPGTSFQCSLTMQYQEKTQNKLFVHLWRKSPCTSLFPPICNYPQFLSLLVAIKIHPHTYLSNFNALSDLLENHMIRNTLRKNCKRFLPTQYESEMENDPFKYVKCNYPRCTPQNPWKPTFQPITNYICSTSTTFTLSCSAFVSTLRLCAISQCKMQLVHENIAFFVIPSLSLLSTLLMVKLKYCQRKE